MAQQSMFGVLDVTSKDTTFLRQADLRLVVTHDEVLAALEWISKKKLLAFDIETTGLSALYDKLVGFSFADSNTAFYVPVGHVLDRNCAKEDYVAILKALNEKMLIYHNAKFDWSRILVYEGIDLPISHDTLALAALIDSHRIKQHTLGLKHLSKELLNIEQLELQADLGTTDFSTVALDDALYYAATDSLCTAKLFKVLYPKIAELQLEQVYQLEISIIKQVGLIELQGLCIDKDFIINNRDKLEELCEELKAEIAEYGDNEYDIDSNDQLAALLFDHLKLPMYKGSRSVGKEAMEFLEEKHEIIPKIQDYAVFRKLANSFFDKIDDCIAEDGKVHGDLNQFGAESGRFSASGGVGRKGIPIKFNSQQMPKAKKGFNFRNAIIPEPGCFWLHCDFSQLEYRCMAALSGEEDLIKAYAEGVDFHVKTASTMLGKPIEAVTKDDRKIGKTMNFGVSYGMTSYGLAGRLHKTPKEAEKLMADYWAKLPKLAAMAARIKKECLKNGYVRTQFGRIRWFDNLPKDDPQALERALLRTFNTVIQGTGADLAKVAIARVYKVLGKWNKANPDKPITCCLSIHDELNFSVHKSIPVMDACRLIHNAMTLNMPNDNVWHGMQFRADCEVGPNFGSMFEVPDEWYGEQGAQYEGLLFDQFLSKVGFTKDKQESKEAEEEEEVPVYRIEKPAVVIEGILNENRAERLREIVFKNLGNYNLFFRDENELYIFEEKLNPTPPVIAAIHDLGLEVTTFCDEQDVAVDLDAVIANM